MQYGLGVTQEKKPRSYTLMVSEALERGEDPAKVEQQVLAEAEQEEKESPIQPEVPAPEATPQASMLENRMDEEAALEKQIRAKEDEVGQSRAGLERGLLGAVQTIGSSSIRRQGGDATAFDKGMGNAQELMTDPMKAAEQRRAFLKERLGRTDAPYRAKTDDLVMKQRERGERVGAATEEDKIAQEKMDTGIKSADLTMKSNAAQTSNKRVDATSTVSTAARDREATKLKRTAMQIGQSDPATARSLLRMADSLENGDMANLSESELGLLEDMKITPPEDQSLEWFKARTARANVERPRVGEEKARMLSDKQVDVVTTADKAIGLMKQIQEEKKKINTGRISNIQNNVAQTLGIDDPEKTAFKARVGTQLADYIKTISGAAVSEQEAKRLNANMPGPQDEDPTFDAKLANKIQEVEEFKRLHLENITKQGKDTSRFMQPSPTSSSQPEGRQMSGDELPEIQ